VDREAARRAQRNRNLMLALSLVAFIVIVYLVTVLRMGGHVAQRPL
jgi:t-SNARE complex subunit (syntaxin)